MLPDPIVDEIHEIRRQMAAEHGDNLQQLGAYFIEHQKLHPDKLVSFAPKRAARLEQPLASTPLQDQ